MITKKNSEPLTVSEKTRYVHCKKCVLEVSGNAGIDLVLYDGVLFIVCKKHYEMPVLAVDWEHVQEMPSSPGEVQ